VAVAVAVMDLLQILKVVEVVLVLYIQPIQQFHHHREHLWQQYHQDPIRLQLVLVVVETLQVVVLEEVVMADRQ
jgi:hypothetical protein